MCQMALGLPRILQGQALRVAAPGLPEEIRDAQSSRDLPKVHSGFPAGPRHLQEQGTAPILGGPGRVRSCREVTPTQSSDQAPA